MSLPSFIEQYLSTHHIQAEPHQHQATYTAHQLAEAEHVPDTRVAKVIFFWSDDQLVMGVLPANRNLNLHLARRATRASYVRLATEREIAERVRDVELGAIPPFGSLFGLPVYLDESMREMDEVFVPGGALTQSLTIRLEDYLREEQPQIVRLSKRPIRYSRMTKERPYRFDY